MENEQGNEPVETEGELNMLAEAKRTAERLEAANAKMESLLRQQESLAVERTLAGKSIAGTPQKREETPEEYAKRVMNNDI